MMTNQKETPKARAGGKGVGSAKGSGADFIGNLPEAAILIAKLHRAGHSVRRTDNGGFIVSLSRFTKYLCNTASLRSFAQKAGVYE